MEKDEKMISIKSGTKRTEAGNDAHVWWFVWILFLFSVVVRGVSSSYLKEIVVYMDELNYVSIGRSLLNHHAFLVQNAPNSFQKALYSFVIMPAFLFPSTEQQICAVAWINSIVMSCAVFPAYGLARRMLKSENWARFFAVLSIIVPNMLFTMTFMSEVVFFPISLCVVYCVWRIIETEDSGLDFRLNLVLGGLCYLAYMNKEIALYYLLAYVIVRAGFCVLPGNDRKRGITGLVAVAGSFVVCFLLMKLTVFRGMDNQYVQSGMQIGISLKKIIYMCYAFGYHLIFAVLAFGVFPVLVTVASIDKKDSRSIRFVCFIALSLVIGCAVIAYMISLQEDWGARSPRQHLRYLEPLMLPFLSSFVYSVKKAAEGRTGLSGKLVGILFGGYLVLFIGIAYDIVKRCHVDNTSLLYVERIISSIKGISLPVLTEEWKLLLLREAVAVIIIFGVLFLFRKTRIFLHVFVGLFTAVCILNTCIGYKEWSDIYVQYKWSGESAEEMSELNDALKEEEPEGNVLLIAASRMTDTVRLVDTYIDLELYITDMNMLNANHHLQDGEVDLSQELIQYWDMFAAKYYEDLDQVQYLLVRDDIALDQSKIELVRSLPAGYSLYRNLEPEKIYFDVPEIQQQGKGEQE